MCSGGNVARQIQDAAQLLHPYVKQPIAAERRTEYMAQEFTKVKQPIAAERRTEYMAQEFTKLLQKKAVAVEDIEYYIKILIYAASGIGKTVLAGTAPDLFIISDENGLLSLKNPDLKDIVNQKAKSFPLDNFIEMNILYEFLYNHCLLRDRLTKLQKQYAGKTKKEVPKDAVARLEKIKDALWSMEYDNEPRNGQEPKLYYCVAIDSLTELQKRSMDRIIDIKHGGTWNQIGDTDDGGMICVDEDEEKQADLKAAVQAALDAAQVDDTDMVTGFADFEVKAATLPDYGSNTNQMRKVVRAFRDLPMNVIFTALEKEVKDDLTGEMYTRPALTDKLSEDVCSYVDIVGYYYVRQNKDDDTKLDRILQVQPFKNKTAKDRSGRLGNGIMNPTFKRIMGLITGQES